MDFKRIFKSFTDYIFHSDIILWIIIAAMSMYSLTLLASVSSAEGIAYDRTQFFAIAMGVFGAIIISKIDYLRLANFWYLIAIFSVFIMIYTIVTATAVVGSGGVNAKAWIKIGSRTFQPSELVKIGFLLTYSKHLDTLKKKDLIDEVFHILLLLFHALVPFMLCIQQGDGGAGFIFFFMFLAMSYSAGIKIRYFVVLGLIILAASPFLWRMLEPYQQKRIIALFTLNFEDVLSDDTYQQYHAQISIGSGQWNGMGIHNGRRVASRAVSIQQSDFIFSVAGEELGFIGCVAIIVLIFLLLLKILHIALSARDGLGRYIAFGFFGLVAVQSIINIGMCISLLPVMGVTLPFFSAGGSSAMCLYFGIGLLQSIHLRRKESDGMTLNRKSPLQFSYRQVKRLNRSR
jgi:Bacterial cell division membrane protein